MMAGYASEQRDDRRPCPKCQHRNRLGILFCEECGTPINTSARSVSTTVSTVPEDLRKRLQSLSEIDVAPAPQPVAQKRATGPTKVLEQKLGTFVFTKGASLLLEIDDVERPLIIDLPQEKALVLGRHDEVYMPEIDLMPYNATSFGISRRHAALKLRRARLDVVDLKSSNGTFVNNERLDAGEPVQLRDGDKLRLGRLNITVRFYQI